MTRKSMVRVLLWSLCLAVIQATAGAKPPQDVPQRTTIDFWNGNKTAARQVYEREVLEAVLAATEEDYGPWQLAESRADYPKAEDEAAVFREKGHDLFVTVAGNKKLVNEKKIVIPVPLMKGLLGYRILIVREEDKERFADISSADELRAMRLGIPETWADADLFRHNDYKVVERGDFDSLFKRLADGEFDYVAFGANEVIDVYANRAAQQEGLAIDQSLLLYYPFPLVFYVNPDQSGLAERVERGLKRIQQNGQLQAVFSRYYGDIVEKLNLQQRQLIELENPILPVLMKDMSPGLVKP